MILCTGIDHTGIAVRNIEKAKKLYLEMGFQPLSAETVYTESVKIAFLCNGESLIELLQPLAEGSGRLAGFIEKRGEGIHHLAMRVDDIEAAVSECRQQGYAVAGDIRPGAFGRMVAFLHPGSTHGVLIELVQGALPGEPPQEGC